MIQANEIRIGNAVYDEGGIVRWINHRKISDIASNPDTHGYKPIPLTPEILEKVSFVGKTKDGKDFKLHDLMTTMIDDGGNVVLSHSYFMNETIVRNIDLKCSVIKYVHEYQNLYFSLTGEELQIKELVS